MKVKMKKGKPYYDAEMSAWCPLLIGIGKYAIGLEFKAHKRIRCHVQIMRPTQCNTVIPFSLTIGI